MTRVYINGKLFDKADARISVYDHGLLYGLFTTMMALLTGWAASVVFRRD